MNFMPSEDVFYDEPLVDNTQQQQYVGKNYVNANTRFEPSTARPVHHATHVDAAPANVGEYASWQHDMLESSRNCEKLLGRLVAHFESRTLPTESLSTLATEVAPAIPRGTLVLPPGSRPPVLSPPPTKLVASTEETSFRRRAEEEARLARIEAERKEKEKLDEAKRLEELKRIEEAKILKEQLEKKTRGLMTDLLVGSSGGLFDDNDDINTKPKAGGLFDD